MADVQAYTPFIHLASIFFFRFFIDANVIAMLALSVYWTG